MILGEYNNMCWKKNPVVNNSTFNLPSCSPAVIGKSNVGVTTSRTTNVAVSSSVNANGDLYLNAGGENQVVTKSASGDSAGRRQLVLSANATGQNTAVKYGWGLSISNSITQPWFNAALSNTFSIKMIIKY